MNDKEFELMNTDDKNLINTVIDSFFNKLQVQQLVP